MTSLGFTQTSLADQLGVSRESVSQWLKGVKVPRPAALLGLGKALALSFDDLVLQDKDMASEPVLAYRTNRNKAPKEKDLQAARDMAEGLQVLTPYLPPAPIVSPMTFSEPSLEREFLSNAAAEIRRILSATETAPLSLVKLVGQLVQQSIILIPVLWGPNGHNGLHVRLPHERRTFIYLNLDKSWMDFRFWLLHEWAHVLAPQLDKAEGETFADALAAEVLYPGAVAKAFLDRNQGNGMAGAWISAIVAEADSFEISPITVKNRVGEYAAEHALSIPEPDIYGAVTNHLKTIPTVTEAIWKKTQPEVADYLSQSALVFQTPIFEALRRLIGDRSVGPSFIERVLKVPFGDAGGVHGCLAGQ